MSERDSSSEASDQETTTMAETNGKMVVEKLLMASRSLKSVLIEVGGMCCSGFEIGWVTSVAVHLYHGHTLIGEMTISNKAMVPDSQNRVAFVWNPDEEPECEYGGIQVSLRRPQKGSNHTLDDRKRVTADLSVSPTGHDLKMSIDLANMPRMRAVVQSVMIFEGEIQVSVDITNLSPLRVIFDGICYFKLLKDQRVIGHLMGGFDIDRGITEYEFKGTVNDGASGMAVLKGDRFSASHHSTWQEYLIQLFEVEVNLGEDPGLEEEEAG
ncbi:hypothetical protein M440DRAFT_1436549 [Trichoderma longibrachiatum ATCC 18648]|uniref:Uncharacterized protein n=1 Tax=Trichoderma longibrachiatum ATCC 18648 TaxID=983965 RepID=A0A2T4CCG2_TRILO|nr:hypothetical protein M440DRAFT_1436549 [Trichoderma longibrachiatum ATCC 18648]